MMSAARDAIAVGVEHNFFAAVQVLLAKKRLVILRRQREGQRRSQDVNFPLFQTLFERSGRNRADRSYVCVWDAGFHSVHLLLVYRERAESREPDAQSEGDLEPTWTWEPSLCASGSHVSIAAANSLTNSRELVADCLAFAVGGRHIIVDDLARGQDQKET